MSSPAIDGCRSAKMDCIQHQMCTLFSTHTNDIWLLGPSIQQVIKEYVQPVIANDQKTPAIFYEGSDWLAFQQEVLTRRPICRKRTALLCDISSLSHEDIVSIRMTREKYAWFTPVIFVDQPDLGKVIHTFNADLVGYCTASDSVDELITMLNAIRKNKLYYSTGFCTLLRNYGFEINENS